MERLKIVGKPLARVVICGLLAAAAGACGDDDGAADLEMLPDGGPDGGPDASASTVERCVTPNCLCTPPPESGVLSYANDPGEEDWLLASEIDLPEGGFEVQRLTYRVIDRLVVVPGVVCGKSIRHTVTLFLSDGSQPPATPEPIWSSRVLVPDEPGPIGNETLVELDIDPPVTVPAGARLFAAAQAALMTATGDPADGVLLLCLGACDSSPTLAERAWRSGASEPPYDWITERRVAEFFGVDYYIHTDFRVVGEPTN